MRRHSQNISFIAIIATLMSCAFFFSQQTSNPEDESASSEGVISASEVESVVDLPDCAADLDEAAQLDCLTQTVDATQILLDSKLDDILDLTPDSDLRIKFVESQISWEDSRDADCDLVAGLEADPTQKAIDEKTCLRDANLDRLAYLDLLYCDLSPDANCPAESLP
jgi:uncharacterized protein YecT (DUF1311 family)